MSKVVPEQRCRECQTTFTPVVVWQKYCIMCQGRGIPQRDAQRAYYARKKMQDR